MIGDIAFVKGFLVLLIWAALVVLAFIKLKGSGKRRLVRCPELGIVTMVEVTPPQPGIGSTKHSPPVSVARCQLWPEKSSCGMGCLSRYEQNQSPFGFDLAALRPFNGGE